MTTDRRSFLRASALAGGALAAGSLAPRAWGAALPDVPRAPRSMRLLILGGTGFIGPHMVAYAVARGHQVTVFNRGRSGTDLPDGVEQLTGDRNLGQVGALQGREWDAVLDNPTTLPFWVRDVGQALQGRAGRYLFISTLSAYNPAGVEHIDEGSPLHTYDGDPLAVTPEIYAQRQGALYGPMKAAAEAESRRWFGEDAVIVRPGLIVGPRDGTDRFTYWPLRLERGGDVVAPGDGTDPVQIIDVRDLVEWCVRLVEDGTRGTFNGVGPRLPLSMASQLHGIQGALSGDLATRLHWIPAEFLRAQGVRPWSEMTTWFGPNVPLSRTSNERSVAAGLTYRSLAQTTLDTLAWFRSLPADRQGTLRAGLAVDTEARVLEAWRRR